MKLHAVDIAIILGYFLTVILIGLWVNCSRDCANVAVGIVWQLCLTALPIYLALRQWSWVGAIAATLGVTSLIIKLNWYDKLEKAPAASARRAQPLPAQTTTL
jgi:hypothetical protein